MADPAYRVFLSHSSKDKDFVKELYRRLTRDGVSCFFDIESIGWGQNWVRALERALNECEFVVFILSPDFCNFEWVEVERTSSLADDPRGLSRKVRPLMLRSCRDLPNFPRFLRSVQEIDVSTVEKFERNYPRICRELGGTVHDDTALTDRTKLAPVSPPSVSPAFEPPLIYFSYSRKDAPWLKKLLMWLRPMEASQQIRIFYDRNLNPGDNWDESLRDKLNSAALGIILLSPEWLTNSYATKIEFPALASRRVIPVLVRECDWSSHPVSQFQILMAEDQPFSAVRGTKQEQAFRALLQSIQTQLGILPGTSVSPGTDPGPSPYESEADSVEVPAGSPSRSIPAYQSEDWTGPDLLNINRDVHALAALVAGWNVQPPLSIGLFGEWGSGKSFFMRQMRKRVKALALAAQASNKPQRECAYYKNIAQIEFNAWHYMEGNNLWACLVEHIFSNLEFPQDTTLAQVQDRQKQILELIGAKKNLEAQTAQTKIELEAKRAGAEKKANEARTELEAAKTALQKEKSALSRKIADELSSEATSILASIPEAIQLHDTVETARKLSKDVRSLGGRIKLLWNLLRHDPQRRRILVWMLSASAVLYGVSQIAHWLAPGFKILARQDIRLLLPIVTALVGTASKFRPVLAKIAHIVSVLEKKNQEITEAISKAEREQHQQIAKLEGDVKTLSQQIDQATRDQQQHQQAIEKLEKELAETDANRLLAEFIRSRADADDYRKHLGMIALVRRDFELLSGFFRNQRNDERSGKERVDNNTVNRIVLYIDDLDRCPPQTVVSMLHAIHLLLAFPIFVVVVAVDARWVSRSLEQCYEWLVRETQPAAQPRIAANVGERVPSTTGATAHDYLEKIFQIPFWLAPMNSKACQSMIRGLTEAVASEHSALKKAIGAAKQQQSVQPPLAAAAVASGSASLSSPPPATFSTHTTSPPAAAITELEPEDIDLTPRQLDIEEAEMRKIDELAMLIGRSPRVAKRFLNCYRLLKARMNQAELETFLEGSFQYVMEALAIIVGAPSISRVVVDALRNEGATRDGEAFLTYLTKHASPDILSTSDAVEVVRLLSAATSDRLVLLRSVLPLVSRFSFSTQTEEVPDRRRVPHKKAKSSTV